MKIYKIGIKKEEEEDYKKVEEYMIYKESKLRKKKEKIERGIGKK